MSTTAITIRECYLHVFGSLQRQIELGCIGIVEHLRMIAPGEFSLKRAASYFPQINWAAHTRK